MTQLSVDIPNW